MYFIQQFKNYLYKQFCRIFTALKAMERAGEAFLFGTQANLHKRRPADRFFLEQFRTFFIDFGVSFQDYGGIRLLIFS